MCCIKDIKTLVFLECFSLSQSTYSNNGTEDVVGTKIGASGLKIAKHNQFWSLLGARSARGDNLELSKLSEKVRVR